MFISFIILKGYFNISVVMSCFLNKYIYCFSSLMIRISEDEDSFMQFN